MNTAEKIDLIKSTNGKFFTAVFTKKDGSLRTMNCRLGVTKHLHGGDSTTKHKENLICVFDTQVGEYRCINLDTLKQLTVNGKQYNI